MDCVYEAYTQYLQNLGYRASTLDYLVYRTLKVLTHGISPQPTFGGMVPFIIWCLAKLWGMSVRIQYRIWTPVHLEASAPNLIQRVIVKYSYFGILREVKYITLQPAIYLLLGSHHAIFSQQVPSGQVVMALQLY